MAEIFVLARMRVMATDAQLRDYRDRVQQIPVNVGGLAGFTTWRSLEPDGGLLQIMRYQDRPTADSALEALVGSQAGLLVSSISIDPPDVILVEVQSSSGKSVESMPQGAFLSLVIKFADPGQEESLQEDMADSLAELAYLPGFLGSFWSKNVALTEEIVSGCGWESREALESSVPTSHRVRLERWQKAF